MPTQNHASVTTVYSEIASAEAADPQCVRAEEEVRARWAAGGAFESILFPGSPSPDEVEASQPPEFFHDVSLDQVVERVVAQWEEYDLRRFFYTAPTDLDVIGYRQEVMRDLDHAPVMERLVAFSQCMRTMRRYLEARKQSSYPLEQARWFLAAVEVYVETVQQLAVDLASLTLQSRGLQAIRDYLAGYVAQPPFAELMREAHAVAAGLAAITYALLIRDLQVIVLPYQGESDYAAEVDHTFERFRWSVPAPSDHPTPFPDAGRLDHVEAQILERVAKLHPAPFAALEAFCAAHADYLDGQIARFDRELPFYLAYLEAIAPLRRAGLSFTYPQLCYTDKTIRASEAFDLALAWKLVAQHATVVCNDFHLTDPQRIFVVSGPNHGGKTTFARMFGQLHYLARLGCPVPGSEARLFVCDQVLTHFERVEDMRYGRGKLQDELVRIYRVLRQATPNSIIIMNEIFASTTLRDAEYLGLKIMAELSSRDLLAVCVTFLDELAAFDEKTVSLVSAVNPRDPTIRTFKLDQRPADGLAYAVAIAEKYRVTGEWLQRRMDV